MPDVRAALKRMRVQNPELGHDFGAFLIEKSTTAVEGGLQWTFDPLHKTWSPRPFNAEAFGDILGAIESPTLVVGGEHGFQLADEEARVGRIRRCERARIASVGHMIHWFAADALAETLGEFFARHPA